jgi:hypothetical protein
MKANILPVLGVACALACSAASGATYLCTKDPADVSSLSCTKAPRDDHVYSPGAEQSVLPSSATVGYSVMVARAVQDSAHETAMAQRRTAASLAAYNATRTGSDGT